ncbi:DUF3275 family protein [Aromatoleum diolicum]|uniref:DUF3275 family protein n=1 Tax=Aromatoleum diolicum TaxID=75796 RepID=A0ABX1Q9M0_9RHOO|nr:DUF3275 family protein [Aromatoleum diolicum]NMG74240.1 DUF3275 family protein [Aromatoleum diolicum]
MSVTVEGSLCIKRINGANGPFCVGDLLTDIGEFRVKDPVLDQFEEGVYTGHYTIQRIFSWSYNANGRLVVEIRARLADLQIHAGTESSLPDSTTEPDPADESTHDSSAAAPERAPVAEKQDASPSRTPADSSPDESEAIPCPAPDDSSDGALFGEELHALVTSRRPVKLDPAIDDRRRFREQRNRLKSGLHYGFIPEEQTWYPEESDRYQAYLATKSDM